MANIVVQGDDRQCGRDTSQREPPHHPPIDGSVPAMHHGAKTFGRRRKQQIRADGRAGGHAKDQSSGVISEPPPMPVSPITTPTEKPAAEITISMASFSCWGLDATAHGIYKKGTN